MYYVSDDPYPFTSGVAWLRELADTFGAERLLWGSDHPVSARRGYSYDQMLETVRRTAALADVERSAVLGGTAARLLGMAP
jgi:predicted TIM-barrel fold metal-dependent hydrolase